MRAVLIRMICLGVLVLLPARAFAVTIDQIVALAKSGVSESVILALIDRDKTVLPIEPEQLPTLKKQGLSDAVILAMLKSGRAESEAAARVEAAQNMEHLLPFLSTEPDVLIVGHGPEWPNVGFHYDYYPVASAPLAVPYAFPYGFAGAAPVQPMRDLSACTAPITPITRFVGTRSRLTNDCVPSLQLQPLQVQPLQLNSRPRRPR